MLTLGNLTLFLLLCAIGAWLWHGHGVRERALQQVRRHCAKADVQLLDDAVALRRFAWLADAKGRRRLARVYGFEFTVTGEQRHAGSLVMFGGQLGRIELEAHPSPSPARDRQQSLPTATLPVAPPEPPSQSLPSNVVHLEQWRRDHPNERQSKPRA